MTIATATISGQLVLPDLTEGRMVVTLEASSDASLVTYSGMAIGGKIAVPIQSDGTASVTVPQIPQSGLLPSSGVQWHANVKVGGESRDYYFTLTTDTTWDQVLSPSNATISPTLVAQAEAARDAAQAAAASIVLYAPAPIGGTSDDLAALNSVLSAFGGNGGTLYLRGGTYLLSNTLTIPNKVNVIGVGRSGSFLKAHSTFPINTPLIALGPSGLAFSSRLERASVDCNNVAGSIGVYSFQGQEMCGVDKVAISNFKDTGIHFDTGAADFAIDDVECYPSSTGANYGIHLHNPGSNIIRKATCGVSGLLTAGIYINGGEAVCQSVHFENCTDGIVYDNARGFVYGCSGPTVTANVTNLIRMASNCRYLTLIDITKNSATNTFVDQFFSRTVTDPFVQTAVLGDMYVARLHHNGDQLGFYNTTPIARQTRAGQLTVAAGTPSTTTTVDVGAAFSQTVLNNQIATLATKINALETIVHNLGLST